ncbi:hypothetical protein [Methylomonas koyamae]|uniref:hypothetical protein n=1 Tax=Methylomonas koyamae TaxID=702114 RepID=UPI000AC257AE|nr:hypothetical protein [Methylomonas koyamae]
MEKPELQIEEKLINFLTDCFVRYYFLTENGLGLLPMPLIFVIFLFGDFSGAI